MDKQLGIIIGLSSVTGWGNFGVNLTLQLLRGNRVTPLLLVKPTNLHLNPLERARLAPVLVQQAMTNGFTADHLSEPLTLGHPVLHALANDFQWLPASDAFAGQPDIGAIFFESSVVGARARERAKRFAGIIAGSTWNADILRANGIAHVMPVFQGIDPMMFHPTSKSVAPAQLFPDRFVLFSGGKLEFRKGQDIVIAAFRAFRARHPEALLITAWGNIHPDTMAGIDAAGHVQGLPATGPGGRTGIVAWLAANGLPDDSVIDVGIVPNSLMGQIMRQADAALFTNRCEGGTNLVAMECLACGLPTILSANTGHLDLIAGDNCYALTDQQPVAHHAFYDGVEGWGETSVDEAVAALERIYDDREEAKRRGMAAATFMQDMTWAKQIDRLLAAIDAFL